MGHWHSDWQAPHYDQGLLTALCGPAYIRDALHSRPGDAADDVTDVVPRVWPTQAGLVVFSRRPGHRHERIPVHVPPDAVAVQVGETAAILSGGALLPAPHAVARPTREAAEDFGGDAISRDNFVVFCQPLWGKQLSPPGCSVEKKSVVGAGLDRLLADSAALSAELAETSAGTRLPSLGSRWVDGCTYSDFYKRTVEEYFRPGKVAGQPAR